MSRSTLHGADRFEFGRKTRPNAEAALAAAIGLSVDALDFEWIDADGENGALDRELGIDLFVSPNASGGRISAQVKTLSLIGYKTITVETLSPDSLGDWDDCRAQLYCVCYVDPDTFQTVRWAVLNWAQVVIATATGKLRWKDNRNADGRAQATFKQIPFVKILENAPEAVIAFGGDWKSSMI